MRLAIVLLLSLAAAATLGAQPNTVNTPPCNESWCVQAKYKYFFCDAQGNKVEKCTADPNNELGLKPFKKATPQQLCDDWSRGDEYGKIYVTDTDPSTPDKDIFVNSHMHDQLVAAHDRWEYLCPPQGPNPEYQACCIPVFWTRTIADMGSSTDAEANTRTMVTRDTPLDPHSCEFDCPKSFIALNMELSHLAPDANGIPTRFLFTEKDNVSLLPGGYHYSYAYSVLVHELGHWYGFGHDWLPGMDGQTCERTTSIMHSGSLSDWDRQVRDLDDGDICMFKKMYCCAATQKAEVLEEQELVRRFSFDVIPNPAATTVLVRFGDRIESGDVRIRVVSTNGEAISERSVPRESREVSFDVSGLAPGVYLFEVVRPGFVCGRKLVIQH